ncbi:hypothetical protein ACFWIA_12760 [Streptomyces sp. NPDC127068]|uniref:hypothetical protein n=1 Tax=Streptomyces sp. NPDC127068 TaxID=3347127 RepID=UPI00366595AE
MVASRLTRPQIGRAIRLLRDGIAAENLTLITWTRRDGFMLSDDHADWIEYDKRQFPQILGRLTRVITGTFEPHLARYPDDEWAQLAPAQLTGVRATLAHQVAPAAEHPAEPAIPAAVRRRRCPSDTSAAEWALLEPLLPPRGLPDQDRRTSGEVAPTGDRRGIRCIVDNGAKWRALAHPAHRLPAQTGQGLRRRCPAAGKSSGPSAGA